MCGRCSARPRRPTERSQAIVRTAFVSTYPPRRCGIATFTQALAGATGDREIVALHPPDQASPYPPEVHHRIRRDERADYALTARVLDDCVDVVSIQHEYGIWGGQDGAHVIDLARALDVPAVSTLHTVLRHPTESQRDVLSELIARSAATVVMSRSAAALLTSVYGADPHRLNVIPHGVPDLPLVDPATVKPALGLEGRDVILSFGLLGPGKGYELALDALPAVVKAHPAACYVVVGATHPDLLRREGEAYRQGLVERVHRLGMDGHVRFVDRFVGRVELTRWLEAADVFVTPYPNLDQIVSGTLSYAMGAGRAVVSTPYAYAAELLGNGRGILVPPASAADLARALNDVIGDRDLRAAIGRRAYEYSRRMVWSAVGAEYRRLFDQVSVLPRAAIRPMPLAVVNA
jgi:glycosyltransferase involved in cell wall biosynthesis